MKKKQLVRFLFFAVLFLGVGCTKVDVKYPAGTTDPDPDPETESAVVINPSVAMSAGTKYYFYPSGGGEPTILTAKEDGSFDGKLPFGTYRLLAVNADAQGVEFKNMSSFDTAGVYLKSSGTRQADSRVQLIKPSDVHLLSISEVVVEEGKTATYSGTPQLLTHTLNITLNITGDVAIGLSGRLNGFFSGISLSSGEAIISDAATNTLSFAATSSGSSASFSILSLGILNPAAAGNAYTSMLELEVTTASGTHSKTVDMSNELIDAADASGTILTGTQITASVEITTDPEPEPEPEDPTQSTPGAGAENWGTGEDQEGTLK